MSKSSEIASEMNQAAILQLLRNNGPMSKADITRHLGLSFPAVSYNVKKLMENDLVYSAGGADNAIGRKATLLAFNSKKAYVVGVDLGRKNIRLMCADIAGSILKYQTHPIESDQVFQQIIRGISDIVEASGVKMNDVICIGVGMPGIYEPETDTHRFVPFAKGWGDRSLFSQLKEEYRAQIIVENSVNLGAVGERWQGVAKGCDNLLYVDFGVGFGAALIMNGELIRGRNGAFGEIGYLLLDKNKISTQRHEEGALERIIPSEEIANTIQTMYRNDQSIDLKTVLEQVGLKDATTDASNIPVYFAMALVNTIAVTNPEMLVISGRLGCAIYREYSELINDIIVTNVPYPPRISCTDLAERANVLGAIAMAMTSSNKDYHDLKEFR